MISRLGRHCCGRLEQYPLGISNVLPSQGGHRRMACRRKVFRPIALTLISSRSASCRSCRSCPSPEHAVEPSALHQTALSGKSTSWSTSVEAQTKHGCERKRGHAEATLLHSYCMNAVVGGVNRHFPRTFYRGASIRFPIDWGRQGVCVRLFDFYLYEYHITAFGRGYNLVERRSVE